MDPMTYEHILAATDFSELGDLALCRAAELALALDCRLTAVHILPEPESPSPLFAHYEVHTDEDRMIKAKAGAVEALRERIPKRVRESGLSIEYVVCMGDPVTELLSLDASRHPDLLVLATHGRRGFQRWIMGSVAERVVQMAHADVLAVRRHPEDEAT